MVELAAHHEMVVWGAGCSVFVILLLLAAILLHVRDLRNIPEEKAKRRAKRKADFKKAEQLRIDGVSFEAIPKSDFLNAVKRREKKKEFNYEFKAINKKEEKQKISDDAIFPHNKKKNASDMVLPYERNIVELDPHQDDIFSDYINASWINGHIKTHQYIATQGPTLRTIGDFWRMVWQHDCCCIVMVTNLFEHARQQCEKYWHNTFDNYDGIDVWTEDTCATSEYTVRTFRLGKDGYTRQVCQFQFQTWSETDPPHVASVLEVRRQMTRWMENRSGPVVVHCSHGSGRTGTFISIDIALEKLAATQTVDICSIVAVVHNARPFLVATLDQYRYIYKVVANYIECGTTVIPADQITKTMQKLAIKSPTTRTTGYEDQLNTINSYLHQLTVGECAGGHRTENRWKSRDIMIQPPERARPYLISFDNTDCTDYINALYVDGYKTVNQYIVSQWPLKNTVIDLWRLIHDHHVSIIVVLHDFERNVRNFPWFWPSVKGQATGFGPVQVHLDEEFAASKNIRCRVFDIQKLETNVSPLLNYQLASHNVATTAQKQKVKPRQLVMLQLHTWPQKQRVPDSPEGIVEIVQLVEEWNDRLGSTEPILVISKDGVSRAGVYCVTHMMLDRLRCEGEADIFRAVEKVKRNRPQLIESIDEYHLCHETVYYCERTLGRSDGYKRLSTCCATTV